MLNLLKPVISRGYLFLERLAGLKVFERVLIQNASSSLKSVSIAGHFVSIYVVETNWITKYNAWLVPNKTHRIFNVRAMVSSQAPEYVKKACELDISVPALHPWFVENRKQQEAAISAYVDVLIERINKLRM